VLVHFQGRRASKPLAGVFVEVHGVSIRMLYVHTVIEVLLGRDSRRREAVSLAPLERPGSA
jgi:hypothetical protein